MCVSIKLYTFKNESNEATELGAFNETRQEIFILSKLLNHWYIVKFTGFVVQPQIFSVMELADQGRFKRGLYDPEKINPYIVLLRIAQQLLF